MKNQVTESNQAVISKRYPTIKRRNFFKLVGGGIFIYFSTWDPVKLLALPVTQPNRLPEDFNAFLQIGEDGFVKAFTGKIEMGQGPVTSLAQMLADELDVPFDKVQMVMGDTDLCPWDRGTFGSMTTRIFGPSFRMAAAEARAVLLAMGSKNLGVPVEQLKVSEGIITDTLNQNRNISYAQLAKGRKIERFMDEKPELKKASDYKIMGKPFTRQDARLKVTGEAKYSGDFTMPGILFARILRPPSHGATLLSADTSEAEKTEGVQIVRNGNFIAVLHELPDKAEQAMKVIKAEYSFQEKEVNDQTIFKYLLEKAPQGNLIHQSGSLENGRSASKTITESEFFNSYVAHAPMEPHTALSYMENGRMIVRGSTQTPFPAREEIAKALDLPLEKVRVITPFLGGGFGGKSDNQQMVEAALLSKSTGRPVMVAWTREEEFFYDTFRPAAVVKIKSGVDTNGKIQLWDYHEYFAGDGGSEPIYDVPNTFINAYGNFWKPDETHPFATGPWRAPGNNTNTFARESQIEIMAMKAGMDPLEFRIKNLKDEKMAEVLKTAAEKFGWKTAKGPSGRGYGISCGTDVGTYVVTIAEVKVDTTSGKVQVVRVTCAQNMGQCINPEGARIQMEGCIIMGLGYVFSEEIKFNGGKILTRNFDSYGITRFSWIPKIDTFILDKPDEPPQGGGEPAIINMGAAIANAVFDATGARLYHLPMTTERVLEALKRV